ncbi:unnamed protein product [Ixodes pacificus]
MGTATDYLSLVHQVVCRWLKFTGMFQFLRHAPCSMTCSDMLHAQKT